MTFNMASTTEIISLQECATIVKNGLQTEDFKLLSLKEAPLGGRSGFLGDHFRVTLNVEHHTSDGGCRDVKKCQTKTFALFAKKMPKNGKQKELVEEMRAFEKEVLFYRLLADEYSAVLGSPWLFPKCHIARSDMLLLDDVGVEGFSPVGDSRAPLDLEHSKQVLTSMARFHAASIVIEEKSQKRMEERFPELMYETAFDGRTTTAVYRWFKVGIEAVIQLLPLLPKYKNNPQVLEAARAQIPEIIPRLFGLVKPDPEVRNVFCHGDLWGNNAMFKYQDKCPLQAIFIDFQALRFCNPAHDIMSYLHIATSQEQRQKHLKNLLDIYYDEFSLTLQKHNIDVNDIFTRSEFDRSVKKQTQAGTIMATLYYPVTHMNPECIERVYDSPETFTKYMYGDRTAEAKQYFQCDPSFRLVMNEAMECLIDNYVV